MTTNFLTDDISWTHTAENSGYHVIKVILVDRTTGKNEVIYQGKLYCTEGEDVTIFIDDILRNYAYKYPLSTDFSEKYNASNPNIYTTYKIKDETDGVETNYLPIYLAYPYINKNYESFITFSPWDDTNCIMSTITQGTKFYKSVIKDSKTHKLFVPEDNLLPHYPFIKTNNYGIVNSFILSKASDRTYHYVMNNSTIKTVTFPDYTANLGSLVDYKTTLTSLYNTASYDNYLNICHGEIEDTDDKWDITWYYTTYEMYANSDDFNMFIYNISQFLDTEVVNKFNQIYTKYPSSGFPKTISSNSSIPALGPSRGGGTTPTVEVYSLGVDLGLSLESRQKAQQYINNIISAIPTKKGYTVNITPYSDSSKYDEQDVNALIYKMCVFSSHSTGVVGPLTAKATQEAESGINPVIEFPHVFGSLVDANSFIGKVTEWVDDNYTTYQSFEGELYSISTVNTTTEYPIFSLNMEPKIIQGQIHHETNMAHIAVIDECASKYYLMWQDRLGGIQSRGFDGKDTFKETMTYKQVEDYNGHKRNATVDVTPSWEINTTYLNDDEYAIYESIYTSPYCILYSTDLDKSYKVIPSGSSFTEKTWDNTKKAFNLTLEVKLDKTQNLIY